LIRSALVPHRARNTAHDGQAETAIGRFCESSKCGCIAGCAGVERYAVIFECHQDTTGADLYKHLNAQFAASRRTVAHDVADDFLANSD
jgi:hypothetical protein